MCSSESAYSIKKIKIEINYSDIDLCSPDFLLGDILKPWVKFFWNFGQLVLAKCQRHYRGFLWWIRSLKIRHNFFYSCQDIDFATEASLYTRSVYHFNASSWYAENSNPIQPPSVCFTEENKFIDLLYYSCFFHSYEMLHWKKITTRPKYFYLHDLPRGFYKNNKRGHLQCKMCVIKKINFWFTGSYKILPYLRKLQ